MSSFGEILRSLREKKGLKHGDIANLIGINGGAISKYENAAKTRTKINIVFQ